MTVRCSKLLRSLRQAIEEELQRIADKADRPLSLLDIGCWDGEATELYRHILRGPAYGIEVFPEQAQIARERDIDVAALNLEEDTFPWADASIDVVICNQVFEHLKNIFLPISEIARVLKPGGTLVFSVPNLAALHNRVLLLLGRQPSSIRVFGPHVRGFTYQQARAFLERGGAFEIERSRGIGSWRYGVPRVLGSTLPALAHTPVLVARRTTVRQLPWMLEIGDEREHGQQTFYSPAAE